MNAGNGHPKLPGTTTPTIPPANPQKNPKKEEGERLNAALGKHVMSTLGKPDDLRAVQVRWLWEDHYRVNVFVGPDAASAKVANSYFLVVDDGGNIIASTPTIRRQYPSVVEEVRVPSAPIAVPSSN
jgi:hypothetical protein